MSEENSFGNVLKSFRVRKGTKRGTQWTQRQMAEKLGVSLRTYIKWEIGESTPSDTKDLENIKDIFGLNETDTATLYRAMARVSPEIHNSRFPRKNPFFTGREARLEQLEQRLKENGSVAITQPIAISGLGGVGKTQLVIEYAHRHHPKPYRTVFWVNAASGTTLQEDYDDFAHLLKLPERTESNPDRGVEAVKLWLDRHSEWLLIMDNADDLQPASSFLPVTPDGGHIILTTRSQIVDDITNVVPIEIEEMEPEEGLLFLLWRSGILKDKTKLDTAADVRETAVQLVQMLERFPLALDQAAAYIQETGVSLVGYIQRYQEKRHDLLQRRGSSKSPHGQHPESVATTFELSLEKACEYCPQAADVLYFCSFLQPDAMPEEVLLQADDLKLDTFSLDEVTFALQRYSLIRRNTQERTFSMHRLVQAVLKDTMNPQTMHRWAERTVLAVNAIFPQVEPATWPQCKRLLAHALVCNNLIEEHRLVGSEMARLLHQTGIYLYYHLRYQEAEPLYQRALTIREQQLGLYDPYTASSVNNLALLYKEQGRYAEAEPLYQRAIMIWTRQHGPEHPKTAQSLNNLANLYKKQGKYTEAETLYQRTLAIREQRLGPDDPDTAQSLNNLAKLYNVQGRYAEAEPLYQRALTIREQQLGPHHPSTATSINNLVH